MDIIYCQIAAVIYAFVCGATSILQLLLAFGAPLGQLAWGGRYRVLPTGLRIASASSPLHLIGSSVIMLIHVRLAALPLDRAVTGTLVWIFTGLMAVSFLLNLFSKSRMERLIMVPGSCLAFLSALFIAFFG